LPTPKSVSYISNNTYSAIFDSAKNAAYTAKYGQPPKMKQGRRRGREGEGEEKGKWRKGAGIKEGERGAGRKEGEGGGRFTARGEKGTEGRGGKGQE